MPSLVFLELLSSTKARRTNVNTFLISTVGIRAFDADSMGEVTCARIALVLHTRLVNSCAGIHGTIRIHGMRERDMEITLNFVGQVLGLPLGNGHLSNETGAPN